MIDNAESPGDNVEQLWSKFKVSIAQVVDKYIPHKLAKKRHGLPRINQNIRRLIRKRDRLYKLCKVSFSEAKYADFKSLKHLGLPPASPSSFALPLWCQGHHIRVPVREY